MSAVVATSGTSQLASLTQVDEQCTSTEAWAALTAWLTRKAAS